MNTLNKIIDYKKRQKRVEVIQKFYTMNPFINIVYNVELSIVKKGTIKVVITFDNNRKYSFSCVNYNYPKLYNQLKGLL